MFVKIVCTIGPASENYDTLKAMADAGMNVARLNFSHGDYEGHEKKLKLVRQVERDVKKPIAALLDTKGPEIRTGRMQDGAIPLEQGGVRWHAQAHSREVPAACRRGDAGTERLHRRRFPAP